VCTKDNCTTDANFETLFSQKGKAAGCYRSLFLLCNLRLKCKVVYIGSGIVCLQYGSLDFVWDNPGEPVPEETFTHSHLSWSSVIPYLFPPSIMIHGILFVQFMCLTVFIRNLSPGFLWSTSWPGTLYFIFHTFVHPIIVFFLQHMPIPSQPVLL